MNEIDKFDKYTKEELYDMCNELMHTKELYESMLDVYDEMVTWYERKIEERNDLLYQYKKLADEMLDTMKGMK